MRGTASKAFGQCKDSDEMLGHIASPEQSQSVCGAMCVINTFMYSQSKVLLS